MSNPEIYAIAQLCQSCEHTHEGIVAPGSTTGMPPCASCGCTAFRLHADDLARADAADAEDARDFPDGRVLRGDMAYGLHRVVVGLESQMTEEYGWDVPPMLGMLHQAPVSAPEGMAMMSIAVTPLDLDYAGLLAAAQGNLTWAGTLIADMAERSPSHFDAWRYGAGGINPRATVLGWWASFEAYLRPDGGGEPVDEMRKLLCIDIDERVHDVTRLRRAGDAFHSVDPLRRYQAQISGDTEAVMSPLIAALLRLIRVTRTEAALLTAGMEFRAENT